MSSGRMAVCLNYRGASSGGSSGGVERPVKGRGEVCQKPQGGANEGWRADGAIHAPPNGHGRALRFGEWRDGICWGDGLEMACSWIECGAAGDMRGGVGGKFS